MPSRRWLPIFGLPALVCALWTVAAGKDLNWDLLNYHYYLPYELLGGRLDRDFFAASAQSYLNPLGYVPFYLMVSAEWHSVIISVLLALWHSLSLALLYLIAFRLFAGREGRERALYAGLATAMGAATWIFWPMVGTSFLDPLLAPLVLAGLLLLLVEEPWRAGLSGALLGAAAALKYSNALYVLAALPLALAAPASKRARLRRGMAFIGGTAFALAALAGPWFAMLMREFGNPVFPLMNGLFRSPDALAVNLANDRFLPGGWLDALALPFHTVALDRHLYSETFAPDVRLAALVLLIALLPITRAYRAPTLQRALAGDDRRVLAFLVGSWVLWLVTSANARYGLVLLLLAGVVLVRLGERLLPERAGRILLLALLAVQLATSVIASPTRWYIAEKWSTRWLPYQVDERARREPALYLSVEVLPMAVVAPFLHPGSSFVNFRGQHSLASDSPRLVERLERYRGEVRALGRRLQLVDGVPTPAAVKSYDDAFRQLGYRLDPHECFTIAWRPEYDALSRAANGVAATAPSPEPLSVVSCALHPVSRDPADIQAERRMSDIFARIEKRCPLLRGQSAVTETFGAGWMRHYNGLDARLEAFGGAVILDRFRAGEIVDLGRVTDWERDDAPLPAACMAGAPRRPAL